MVMINNDGKDKEWQINYHNMTSILIIDANNIWIIT
jgi:hypothetical protein